MQAEPGIDVRLYIVDYHSCSHRCIPVWCEIRCGQMVGKINTSLNTVEAVQHDVSNVTNTPRSVPIPPVFAQKGALALDVDPPRHHPSLKTSEGEEFSADPGHVGGFGVLVDGVGRGLPRAVACGKEYTIVATYPYEGPVMEVSSVVTFVYILPLAALPLPAVVLLVGFVLPYAHG